jgi:1-acyl-sn-glycerol-3-phosphate acyltransferase
MFRLTLRLMGWKIDPQAPAGVKKCVVVVGPHTSNWDFIIGWMAFQTYGVKGRFLIKKELFFPPLGWLLKAMGGLPVDRSRNNNLTEQAVKIFRNYENMYMVFTPEGTRDYNPNWKKGFYYIALRANVPIYIAYIDFANKKGGFLSLFEPTGDVVKDIEYIKEMLRPFKGKYPEKGIH